METTRLKLPFILAGQAQKELTHNEALAKLDGCIAPSVVAVNVDHPPEAIPGQAWIIGVAPTGAWAGHGQELAVFDDSGWRFLPPLPGMLVWSTADSVYARWTGNSWSLGLFPLRGLIVQGSPMLTAPQPAVADPAGGSTVDSQARTAISGILRALREHGLLRI